MPSPTRSLSPPPLKRRRRSTSTPPNLYPPPTSIPILPTLDSPLPAPPRPLRIYTWNINGIAPFLPSQTRKITSFLTTPPPKAQTPVTQPSLRACLHRWKWPHVLLLQEVKIANTDTRTQAALQRAINTPSATETNDEKEKETSIKHEYDAHFNLPSCAYNATACGGKIYGVCTLIRRDIVATGVCVRGVDWDKEGRVLVAEMPEIRTVVVNVYCVNGTGNAYRDAETGKVIGDRHGRKRAVHSLLAGLAAGYEEKGWGVVVAGDMNVARGKGDSFPCLRMGEEHVRSRADFEGKFIASLGMIDTFRFVHGEKRKFTYRPTNKPWGAGGDRVDMILTTKGLKGSIKAADILDNEEDRGPSDHVPLFVELEVGKINDEEQS